jgi:hypothetical protein
MGNRQEAPKPPKTSSAGQGLCFEVEESMYYLAFLKKSLQNSLD